MVMVCDLRFVIPAVRIIIYCSIDLVVLISILTVKVHTYCVFPAATP